MSTPERGGLRCWRVRHAQSHARRERRRRRSSERAGSSASSDRAESQHRRLNVVPPSLRHTETHPKRRGRVTPSDPVDSPDADSASTDASEKCASQESCRFSRSGMPETAPSSSPRTTFCRWCCRQWNTSARCSSRLQTSCARTAICHEAVRRNGQASEYASSFHSWALRAVRAVARAQ